MCALHHRTLLLHIFQLTTTHENAKQFDIFIWEWIFGVALAILMFIYSFLSFRRLPHFKALCLFAKLHLNEKRKHYSDVSFECTSCHLLCQYLHLPHFTFMIKCVCIFWIQHERTAIAHNFFSFMNMNKYAQRNKKKLNTKSKIIHFLF